MELGEQTTRLLDANGHDRLDSPDAEQAPVQRGWTKRTWRDRDPSWRYLVAVAVLVGLVCGAVGYSLGLWARKTPGTVAQPGVVPLRIMVAGDSISQGCESLHTWRYRLWEWFHENDIPVVFVGPFHQTQLQEPDLTPGVHLPAARLRPGDTLEGPLAIDIGYALDVEPEFLRTGSAHFAIWGREISQDLDIISQQIQDYKPDYLLVELGLNDLAFGSRTPDQTLLFMEQFIHKAREINPELSFAIADIPQRSKVGDLDVRTKQYNKKLPEKISKWSSPSSPVQLVNFQEAYSCDQTSCPGSVDGIHPNGRGEFEIAHAFSNTLHHKFGLGQQPLALPAEFPNRTCTAPATSAVYRNDDHIRFAWDYVYGAYGYEFQVRQRGAEWIAPGSANFTKERHIDTPWTTGQATTWEFRARTYCESTIQSSWTDVVSAVGV